MGNDDRERESTPELLERFRKGDQGAAERLFTIFYNELRRIAAGQLYREAPGHTLQPTALVNELYFKVIQQKALPVAVDEKAEKLQTASDFFQLSRYLMAQILIEYGRAKRTQKRKHIKVDLDEARIVQIDSDENLTEVLAALDRLESQDPDLRRIVDLRFFGGYSIAETAESLGVGQTKVKADWRVAKLWLQRELRLLDGIVEGGTTWRR